MINTWSKFIFGTTITANNADADFKEGITSLLATLTLKSRTLGEIIDDLEAELNLNSLNNYVVTLNRSTGKVTVSGTSNFTIPLLTGANIGTSIWPLLGFTSGIDLTGANSYTGTSRAGVLYYPQFLLQSYVGPDDYQVSYDPMVNRTASGRTELIRFGVDKMIEFDLKFITNLQMDGVVIKNNPSGVQLAQSFLQDITSKSRFEFVPDIDNPATFYKVVCDSVPSSKDGTGYHLKELFNQDLPGIFETGIITLRVVS
jgi:hypothetical protein